MSYMYTASSSFPKVRQEGFHTQSTGGNTPVPGQNPGQAQSTQGISAQTTFDPNSIYTSGALFADAYRATPADPFARRYEQQQQQHQQQQGSSLDIHEELSFLNPPTSATSESFQQQQQRPHEMFGANQPHYPSVSLPHSRPLYARDDFSSTTPASVHNSYGRAEYFPNGGPQHQSNTGEAARQPAEGRQSHDLQQQQPQSYGMMPSALSNSSAVDSFNPGGEQAPATGVTRSRSRSRSKVSASRSRVSKRPSLPAPPHEEDGESPDSSRAQSTTRPSAIVIPGGQAHHGHHASHSFSSYHTAGTGHPTSPATWGFPGHSAAGEQLFGQSFGGPGSLGPGQSPTTHSGSPPPTGNIDAATKLALANEKRRKRRESHNAVERRRRDNINEKIQELALLLPEEWLEPPSAGGAKNGGSGNGGATAFGQSPSLAGLLSGTVSGSALGSGGAAALLDEDSKEVKANKGVILRNSVEYIKNLVQLVQVQRNRNQQLESELAQYRNRFGNVIGGPNGGAGNISLNGSMNQGGISPGGGMQYSNHTDDDANAMAGYVLTDSLNSPESYDMKNMIGGQSGVGPLDTIGGGGVHSHGNHHHHHGGGHGHTLSSGSIGMDGVETSSGQPFGLSSMGGSGMIGMGIGMGGLTGNGGPASSGTMMQGNHHHHNNNNNMMLGVAAMMTDKTSPSTGSGEGEEGEDDDVPMRGRPKQRLPKQEDEMPVL